MTEAYQSFIAASLTIGPPKNRRNQWSIKHRKKTSPNNKKKPCNYWHNIEEKLKIPLFRSYDSHNKQLNQRENDDNDINVAKANCHDFDGVSRAFVIQFIIGEGEKSEIFREIGGQSSIIFAAIPLLVAPLRSGITELVTNFRTLSKKNPSGRWFFPQIMFFFFLEKRKLIFGSKKVFVLHFSFEFDTHPTIY